MKNLIVLFALILGISVASAQDYTGGAQGSGDAKLTAKVITPLKFTSLSNASNAGTILPDVVKGTFRDLVPDQGIWLFKIERDENYPIAFSTAGVNPVDGLKLAVKWFWSYEDPMVTEWSLVAPEIMTIGNWTWAAGSGEGSGYMILKVKSMDATTASLGVKTFVCNILGHYTGL